MPPLKNLLFYPNTKPAGVGEVCNSWHSDPLIFVFVLLMHIGEIFYCRHFFLANSLHFYCEVLIQKENTVSLL